MNCLAPSILSADLSNLSDCINTLDGAGAHYIHLGVMDGGFVPRISFGDQLVSIIRDMTDKVIDVHLMVNNPEHQIPYFIEAGADIISVHAEACRDLDKAVRDIKKGGVMASVALNPATPIDTISHILPELDMVLLMSANPGFFDHSFIDYTLEKIKILYNRIKSLGLSTDIEVYGGINLDNAPDILYAGANVLVVGNGIFCGNVSDNIEAFLKLM